jgi:hypothetical protein
MSNNIDINPNKRKMFGDLLRFPEIFPSEKANDFMAEDSMITAPPITFTFISSVEMFENVRNTPKRPITFENSQI